MKTLKKIVAMVGAFALCASSVQAMMIDDDNLIEKYYKNQQGWSHRAGGNLLKYETSIINGYISCAPEDAYRIDYGPGSGSTGIIKEIPDNEDTTHVKFEVTVYPTERDTIGNNLQTGPRYRLDLKDELGNSHADIVIGGNNLNTSINGVALSNYGWIFMGWEEPKTLKFDIDYTQNKINMSYRIKLPGQQDKVIDWKDTVDGKEVRRVVDVPILKDYPVGEDVSTMVSPIKSFKFESARQPGSYIHPSALLLDDISLYSSEIDDYVLNDTFEEPAKTTIEDYGYKKETGGYVYRTDDGIYAKVAGETPETISFRRDFEPISTGKVAFQFSMKKTAADGTYAKTRNTSHYYNDYGNNSINSELFTILSKKGDRYIPRAFISGGNSTDLRINKNPLEGDQNNGLSGDKILMEAGKELSSEYFTDFIVIVDLDTKTYDMYTVRPNGTGDYMKVNSNPIELSRRSDEDQEAPIEISRISFNDNAVKNGETFGVTNFKMYTLDNGYSVPEIKGQDKQPVTEVAAGKTVNVYAKTNADKDAKLIVALFDENGKFVDTKVSDFRPKYQNDTVTNAELLKATYTFPEFANSNYKFKAYVWDSMDNMVPLTDMAVVGK